MALAHDCVNIMKFVKSKSDVTAINDALFDIFEGNLLPYVEADAAKQVSAEYFEQIKHRIPPINILKRLVDKLSKLYKDPPIRSVEGGSDKDNALVSWYEKELAVNRKLATANEFFGLSKTALLQIAINVPNKRPILRAVQPGRFMVYSDNNLDPTRPTHVVTFESETVKGKKIRHVYSKDEFAIVDEDGETQADLMRSAGVEGVNPYGTLPFVYFNRSQNLLVPLCDTDTLQMAKLFPVMLADLNTAAMFQSFSVTYMINATPENLTMSPNAVWTVVPTDPEKEPKIGTIKPDVDIDKVLMLIQSQFSLWLNSRGIRPGSVGQLTPENFASGISKMVDEMDTAEERQKQVGFFQDGEAEFWDLLLNDMHPVWVKNGWIENRTLFNPTMSVTTKFHEQLPMTSRSELVKGQDEEVKAGFTTKKRAIKRLNPDFTDEQVDELMAEIAEEKQPEPVNPAPDMSTEKDGQNQPQIDENDEEGNAA